MNNLKKRFVMLLVLVGLVLLGSLLVAQQGPPNACANACLENYTAAVKACHGDAVCLAAAREAAKACIAGCTYGRATKLGSKMARMPLVQISETAGIASDLADRSFLVG